MGKIDHSGLNFQMLGFMQNFIARLVVCIFFKSFFLKKGCFLLKNSIIHKKGGFSSWKQPAQAIAELKIFHC
jgi:hypothetical protein